MSCKKITQKEIKTNNCVYLKPTAFYELSLYVETEECASVDFFAIADYEFPCIKINDFFVIKIENNDEFLKILYPKGFTVDALQNNPHSFINTISLTIAHSSFHGFNCHDYCKTLYETLFYYTNLTK